ncbi:MAG: replication initiation protein, partial [Desulfamplus sp.]|nr:replication initiation protein [Desulfamplus sp.]
MDKYSSIAKGFLISLSDVYDIRIIANLAHIIDRYSFKTGYSIPLNLLNINHESEISGILIENCLDRLMKSIININGKKYSCFTCCGYNNLTDSVEIEIHRDLFPFYYHIKEQFPFPAKMEAFYQLPGHSYNLYEQLKEYGKSTTYKKNFEIKVLQAKMGISGNNASSYMLWSNFQTWVLKVAQQHFEDKSEIIFQYRPYKKGSRKYTHLEFTISPNKKFMKANPRQASLFEEPVCVHEIPENIFNLIPEQWQQGA